MILTSPGEQEDSTVRRESGNGSTSRKTMLTSRPLTSLGQGSPEKDRFGTNEQLQMVFRPRESLEDPSGPDWLDE
ncbi:hypothetical protein AtubIFM56815_003578 [Aspergillus tubingensis]|uniref:Uncharacterized protein n=1 Tax=Aspergillus tubingensis TaxID=5068 RepID=A0A9W6AY68_ASPTU|nr:hypothetical protein AtubIFM54640_001475 [Aspergillus tubingensis]GLA89106.1 hypothetical protein AtubIFM56815_003578 [Aspergillus tubingensis]GLA97119.1 hypothetical protein AtubIFM57143_004605 [Aspergillus tubingensis]GLB22858.1 hypothetical protein AtubIFM61612_003437 [Aspergillus tubingensis]